MASVSPLSPRSFRNDPDSFLPQALGGFVASHPDATWNTAGYIARRSPVVDVDGNPAVAVISGGGSGHEPMHAGFLGEGMLAAAVPGLMFTSPNAVQVTEATRAADAGRGVVHIVKNYTGDVINFRVARQGLPGIDTREVIVADDVATSSDSGPGRRGTGATILVEKVAGASAFRGDDLDEVTRLARVVAEGSRSMAAALTPGHLPTSGRYTFDLGEEEMEVGVGIHGEAGVDRTDVATAHETVARLAGAVVGDLGLTGGDRVLCLVNGLGATSNLELDLVFDEVLRFLADRGVTVVRSIVGSYVTSVNMAGISVTLTRLDDADGDTVVELIDAPTAAPAWPVTVGVDPEPVDATTVVPEDVPGTAESAVNQWLSDFVSGVVASVDDLTELDRLAGDGDFGTNMQAAFGDLPSPLKGTDAEVLAALASRLFIRAGGTSGAVFGTMFREMATTAARGASAALTAGELAEALTRAADAVTELGGAKPGDRTMVDALVPAAEAARAAAEADPEAAPDLAAVHEAAIAGARSTSEITATKGRASYLGERARGVIDPGALVVAWLFGDAGEMN
ncbi:dihydroxyacetone kinase subunit DhaL [Corynebacterium variabile]|uniref:dihydroxyacetone kinase subunit DhaL n=1 Tax=Corynebacterium variabile TaxID=1727 RepID=UPI003F9871F1